MKEKVTIAFHVPALWRIAILLITPALIGLACWLVFSQACAFLTLLPEPRWNTSLPFIAGWRDEPAALRVKMVLIGFVWIPLAWLAEVLWVMIIMTPNQIVDVTAKTFRRRTTYLLRKPALESWETGEIDDIAVLPDAGPLKYWIVSLGLINGTDVRLPRQPRKTKALELAARIKSVLGRGTTESQESL